MADSTELGKKGGCGWGGWGGGEKVFPNNLLL